jgi:hypothetical protein
MSASPVTYILAIDKLTGKAALYNFLSRFSSTHFLQPAR